MTDERTGDVSALEPEPGHPGSDGAVDANERFAERLAHEIEGVLGVGIALESVSLEGELPVRILASCLVDGQIRELAGSGDTILEASRDLIRRAAELRLTAAWWRLVGPA
ncbi:MAG TPA: hypothetical protein VGI98_03940 [Candidatus Limnocylindrales bacterium]|jgi:hypothetical protein